MLDDFDGEILLADSEELEIAERRLLRLCLARVSVDLDAEEVALVLPVEFALHKRQVGSNGYNATHVGHVEQVLRPQSRTTRDPHQVDPRRLIRRLGHPEHHHILFTLAGLPRLQILLAHRAPLEILHPVDLDALLIEEAHRGELVHLDRRPDLASRHVRIVRRPLERDPRHGALVPDRPVGGERPHWLLGLDIPDDILVALVFRAKRVADRGKRVRLDVLERLL